MTQSIEFVDSHTAGEPTRVIVAGGPDLGFGPLPGRVERFRQSADGLRCAMVTEPRGADVLVGALLCEPFDKTCDAGVIFFNNVGYLGMCGHGLIGLVETLRFLGRLGSDACRIETPVGVVNATVERNGEVQFANVASYRKEAGVELSVPGLGKVIGDVAWGGNWFFLTRQPRPSLNTTPISELLQIATRIRRSVNQQGFPEVDHIELFDTPIDPGSNSRNFVLCPGLEYDRSPCGTGTSAKLACLAADGALQAGQRWVQEGILGTSFSGVYHWSDENPERIIPSVSGRAHVTAEGRLLLQDDDPFRLGIPSDVTET
ncbi:proline racemase family protein [Rubripirellula sp.]|nr:proline racemase family protein [Rubripirellula sp.]MDB4338872.1 proline racemase family protein [Rubripirellula sp.]